MPRDPMQWLVGSVMIAAAMSYTSHVTNPVVLQRFTAFSSTKIQPLSRSIYHRHDIAAWASLTSISDLGISPNGADDDNNGKINGALKSSNNNNYDMNGSTTTTMIESSATKLRRLKDLMWVRETLEDLTAAEFACTVEATLDENNNKRKRAVDYEKLLAQLNKRIQDMGCDGPPMQQHRQQQLQQILKFSNDSAITTSADGGEEDMSSSFTCELQSGVGMGSTVYTDAQRTALLDRILRTRQTLMEAIRHHDSSDDDTVNSVTTANGGGGLTQEDNEGKEMPWGLPNFLVPELVLEQWPQAASSPKQTAVSAPATTTTTGTTLPGPRLYVRDDGTVDWDGALQDQAALRKFGTAVWARINGRDPDLSWDDEEENADEANGETKDVKLNNRPAAAPVHAHAAPAKEVTAKIEETPQIVEARQRLADLRQELARKEAEHMALLSSAVKAGQAVANVQLAQLEPEQRNQIRISAAALELLQEKVSYQTLIYELERIYTYLLGELGNPALKGYIPLQDRLNVAEFGLLGGQVDNLNRQLQADEVVDADVLLVVMEQVTDFKRRLGIDYYVTGLSFDQEAIKRWLAELLEKTKAGLAFYVKGVQLFWNDILYCLRLINRAAQGYTLKPREVRTLRRTFKDIITFIPVVIILLIPLSPVGHVLVFGAIQRFFPDFFPSCFTEQRQNLLKLYETAEYSKITVNENWKEKLARIGVATMFALVNSFKAIYISLVGIVQRAEKDKESRREDLSNP